MSIHRPDIESILSVYCPNIVQIDHIQWKFWRNIVQILFHQHSWVFPSIATDQKQKLNVKLNCEKGQILVSHNAYTRSRNRVVKYFDFSHIWFQRILNPNSFVGKFWLTYILVQWKCISPLRNSIPKMGFEKPFFELGVNCI